MFSTLAISSLQASAVTSCVIYMAAFYLELRPLYMSTLPYTLAISRAFGRSLSSDARPILLCTQGRERRGFDHAQSTPVVRNVPTVKSTSNRNMPQMLNSSVGLSGVRKTPLVSRSVLSSKIALRNACSQTGDLSSKLPVKYRAVETA